VLRGHVTQRGWQRFALRHFSGFTDPGYVRVAATSNEFDVMASAYLSPDEDRLAIVVLNVGNDDFDVRLEGIEGKSQVLRTVFRPGQSETWQYLGSLANGWVELPSRSVATVAVEG
jgi:O-glycosyl hydrolase